MSALETSPSVVPEQPLPVLAPEVVRSSKRGLRGRPRWQVIWDVPLGVVFKPAQFRVEPDKLEGIRVFEQPSSAIYRYSRVDDVEVPNGGQPRKL